MGPLFRFGGVRVTDNVVRGTGPTCWDGSGSDNLFFDNHRKTSVPGGRARRTASRHDAVSGAR
jgi:hypothetical protein